MNLHFVKCIDHLFRCSSKGLGRSSHSSTLIFLISFILLKEKQKLRAPDSFITQLPHAEFPLEYPGDVCVIVRILLGISSFLEMRSKMRPKAHCGWGEYGPPPPSIFEHFPFHQLYRITLSDLDDFVFPG